VNPNISKAAHEWAAEVPYGQGNAEYNRNEARVSGEVYDLYRFLLEHPTMAPNRRKDVLPASVNYTPFGYIFAGLVSARCAELIDVRLRSGEDPCAGMQRDHFFTWKESSAHFFRSHSCRKRISGPI
jgi:hypothetical protein